MSIPRTDDGRILIDAWLHYYKTPYFLDSTRDLVESFHAKYPGYYVQLSEHDYVQMPREIAKAVDAGTKPTLGQYYSTVSAAAFDMVKPDGSPLYQSVEAAIGGRDKILDEPITTEDVLDSAQRYFRAPDGTTAVPPRTSTTLMYANMDLLRRAGIDEPPTTWQELEQACRSVVALADGPSHAISWCNHGWMFMQAAAAQGACLVDQENGRAGRAQTALLDSEALQDYVTWWTGLHRDGLYLYSGARKDWLGPFGAFAEQHVAFLITSSVDAPRLVKVGQDRGFEVRACRLPSNGDVPWQGNIIGGDGIFLAADLDPEVLDGTLAFLMHVNGPDAAVDRHLRTNYSPHTWTAYHRLRDQGLFDEQPHRAVAIEQLEASRDTPAATGALVGELPRIQDTLTAAMHDVMVDGVDPCTRLAQANSESQALIDAYNAHTGPGRDLGSFEVH